MQSFYGWQLILDIKKINKYIILVVHHAPHPQREQKYLWRMIMKRLAEFSISLGFIILFPVFLSANTIIVPDDSTTIQAGINGAFEGDTVLVRSGIYYGAGNIGLDFNGKNIAVVGETGSASTVIDGQYGYPGYDRGFYLHSGENATSIIDGFSLFNCIPSLPGGGGGGICCEGASPQIKNCYFQQCSGYIGGGIGCFDGASPTIRNCTFIGNGMAFGGAVGANSASPILESCLIVKNVTAFGGGSVAGFLSYIICDNVTFSGNYCGEAGTGGTVYCDNSAIELTDCIITFGPAGEPVSLVDTSVAYMSCCDVYGNADGDWVGDITGQSGENGNFSADPFFCDTLGYGDYRLAANSPCLPDYNDCGVLIGAYGAGCYTRICGDVNGDYIIDIFDITHLIFYLYMDGLQPVDFQMADVNGDGELNIFDISYLISYLYLGGPAPNCP